MKYLLFLLPFPALAFDYTGVIDARYQEALLYVGAAIAAVVGLAVLSFGVKAVTKWLSHDAPYSHRGDYYGRHRSDTQMRFYYGDKE